MKRFGKTVCHLAVKIEGLARPCGQKIAMAGGETYSSRSRVRLLRHGERDKE